MAWSRESRHARGYGSSWDKLRKRILARDKYLCQQCKRNGRITAGNQCDHIKPKAQGGTDDEQNLETLCRPCHEAKTISEQGKRSRARVGIGVDGWPVHEKAGAPEC